MDNFGSEKFSSIESFGVAGVLGQKSQVFYVPFFNTKNLGRVCDLIVAQLRPAMIDEFHFRNLLGLTVLYSYRAQHAKSEGRLDRLPAYRKDELPDPVFLEVGIDEEKIAIAVSFNLSPDVPIEFEGFSKRVFAFKPIGEFEKAVATLQKYSHRMIVKHVKETRRTEVVTLIGLSGRIALAVIKKRVPLDLIVLEKGKVKQSPKPEKYVDLGDLDYQSLLAESEKEKAFRPSPTGDFQLDSANSTYTRDNFAEDQQKEKELTSELNVLSSTAQGLMKWMRGLSEKSEPDLSLKEIEESLDPEPKRDEEPLNLGDVSADAKDLSEELFGSEEESGLELNSDFEGSDWDDSEEVSIDGISTPFSSLIEGEAASVESHGSVEVDFNSGSEEEGTSDLLSELSKSQEIMDGSVSVQDVSDSFLEKSLASTYNVEKDAIVSTLRDQIHRLKASKYQDDSVNLLEDAVDRLEKEKIHLASEVKRLKINFLEKEGFLKEKLKSVEVKLRGKEMLLIKNVKSLKKVKEELARVSAQLEKYKTGSQKMVSEAEVQIKLQASQKMISQLREENTLQNRRIEDLKGQISDAQTKLGSQTAGAAEVSVLQIKLARSVRMNEDMKKRNAELLEMIQNEKRKSTGNSVAETRKKLESAINIARSSQAESEVLKSKVMTLLRKEEEMKKEISLLKERVK